MIIYELEIHKCVLNSKSEVTEFETLEELLGAVINVKNITPVFVLIAVIKNGVDYGNFLFYLNDQGRTCIIVNEHSGFTVSEKNQASNEPVSFINEQNEIFTMANKDTMTFERALICLNSWILTQDHSDEFVWTEN